MDKNESVMIIDRDVLLRIKPFQGFREASKVNYIKRILDHHGFGLRGDVENNPNYKQPIPYSVVVNPKIQSVFTYNRQGGEIKLYGKISWGFGGHINQTDSGKKENTIITSRNREISEELTNLGEYSFDNLGYINDDSDPVGQVHFGLLYIISTNSTDVKLKGEEAKNGKFRSIDELKSPEFDDNYEVEGWSKIALKPIEEYLKTV